MADDSKKLSQRLADMKAMKAMEDKARAAAQEASPPPPAQGQPDTVSFDQWWMSITKRLNLAPHLKEIIVADFNSRKLKKNELKETYDKAMRLFGYKF